MWLYLLQELKKNISLVTFFYLLHLTNGVKPKSATHSYHLQWWCPWGLLQNDLSQWSRRYRGCPKLQHLPMYCVDRNTDQNPPIALFHLSRCCHPVEGGHGVHPQSPVHHCCMGWMGFVSNLNGVRRQSFGVCIGLWTTPDKPVVNGIPLLLLSDLQPTMKQSYNKDMGLPHSLTLSRRPAFLSSVSVSTEKKTFTKNSPAPVDYSPL